MKTKDDEIELKLLIDNLDINLPQREYMAFVTEKLVQNIDDLITIDNIHLWNSLMNVYQWLLPTEVMHNEFINNRYIPFKIGNEYYAIEYQTFNVYPIKKKDYKNLHMK